MGLDSDRVTLPPGPQKPTTVDLGGHTPLLHQIRSLRTYQPRATNASTTGLNNALVLRPSAPTFTPGPPLQSPSTDPQRLFAPLIPGLQPLPMSAQLLRPNALMAFRFSEVGIGLSRVRL